MLGAHAASSQGPWGLLKSNLRQCFASRQGFFLPSISDHFAFAEPRKIAVGLKAKIKPPWPQIHS